MLLKELSGYPWEGGLVRESWCPWERPWESGGLGDTEEKTHPGPTPPLVEIHSRNRRRLGPIPPFRHSESASIVPESQSGLNLANIWPGSWIVDGFRLSFVWHPNRIWMEFWLDSSPSWSVRPKCSSHRICFRRGVDSGLDPFREHTSENILFQTSTAENPHQPKHFVSKFHSRISNGFQWNSKESHGIPKEF